MRRRQDIGGRPCLDEATQVQLGETIQWQNPESGNSGTVTPTRDGHTESGNYCREYQTTVTIDGKTENAYGVAVFEMAEKLKVQVAREAQKTKRLLVFPAI